MYDIAIIGGGPAGLTASIYATRANKKVIVFEALVAGGQIVNTSYIENYPVAPHITGADFGRTLEQQAIKLGAEIEFTKVTRVEKTNDGFKILTEDSVFTARTVVIATGTTSRKLDLPNEDRLIGHGVSNCATCDGAFYKDKIVTVNGGGAAALHEALYLAEIAKKVYLIHRRTDFRAADSVVAKVKAKKNIELVLDANIIELLGEKKLEAIRLDTGREIELDGLFVAIGRTPNVNKLIEGLELADGDYIKADEDCATNIQGLFVAGDVREKKLRQLVTATCDGALAATAAINYLKEA